MKQYVNDYIKIATEGKPRAGTKAGHFPSRITGGDGGEDRAVGKARRFAGIGICAAAAAPTVNSEEEIRILRMPFDPATPRALRFRLRRISIQNTRRWSRW